jgi:branched-subunit amino acid transport protein AzlD
VFTSRRERRLWLWALVVLVGVFATLQFASTLPDRLRNDDVTTAAFAAALLLVAAAVLTQGLRTRPGGLELGVGLGVGTVVMLVLVRTAIPERSHLMEFGVLAVLVFEALTERKANGRRVPVPALLAVVVTTSLGALDEGIQFFLPSRVFDPLDLVFNTGAAVAAVLGMVALGFARRWQQRRRER